MPKLTDSSIKAAACPADKHRMELSDTACPGLILRVTRAGAKSFLLKYWSPLLSKSVSLTLGSYPALDLAGARDRIADHRKLIAKDKDPRAEQRHERQRFVRSVPRNSRSTSSATNTSPSTQRARRGGKSEQELLEKRCGLPDEAPPALGASAGQLDHT